MVTSGTNLSEGEIESLRILLKIRPALVSHLETLSQLAPSNRSDALRQILHLSDRPFTEIIDSINRIKTNHPVESNCTTQDVNGDQVSRTIDQTEPDEWVLIRFIKGKWSLPGTVWGGGALLFITMGSFYEFLESTGVAGESTKLFWGFSAILSIVYLVAVFNCAKNLMRSSKDRLWPRISQAYSVIALIGLVIFFAKSLDNKTSSDAYLTASEEQSLLLTVSADNRVGSLSGEITATSFYQFENWLTNQPTIEVIVLESTGGLTDLAEEIGTLIKKRQIDTHVETECLSACTLIFLSGSRRSMAEGAQLGFHRFYYEGESMSGGLRKDTLLAYPMLSDKLRRQIIATPPSDMLYLNKSQAGFEGILSDQASSALSHSLLIESRLALAIKNDLELNGYSMPDLFPLTESEFQQLERQADQNFEVGHFAHALEVSLRHLFRVQKDSSPELGREKLIALANQRDIPSHLVLMNLSLYGHESTEQNFAWAAWWAAETLREDQSTRQTAGSTITRISKYMTEAAIIKNDTLLLANEDRTSGVRGLLQSGDRVLVTDSDNRYHEVIDLDTLSWGYIPNELLVILE